MAQFLAAWVALLAAYVAYKLVIWFIAMSKIYFYNIAEHARKAYGKFDYDEDDETYYVTMPNGDVRID
jgi:hypothetical protein